MNMITNVLKKIETMLEDKKYINSVKKNESDFTRDRKLPFKQLIVFILTLPKKSLSVELNDFFKINNLKELPISKQAFSKAREKVSETVFKDILDITVNTRYESGNIKLYKGYRILAEDGSTVELPIKKNLIDHFGVQSNQKKDVPMARISTIVDVLNDIIIDCDICEYTLKNRKDNKDLEQKIMGIDERNMAIKHLDKLKNGFKYKNIILYDRGYPGRELIKELEDNKQFFVMRVSNAFLKNVVSAPMGESVVEYEYKKKTYKLRVLKSPLNSGTVETLITNLPFEEFTFDELNKLYFMRWGVETKYAEIKNKLKLKNFSGLKVITIKQDFLATIIFCNIAGYLKTYIDYEIEASNINKNNKYKQKTNKNVLFGAIKSNLGELLLNKIKKHDLIKEIVAVCKRSRSYIDPNRTNERTRKNPKPRFHNNAKSAI